MMCSWPLVHCFRIQAWRISTWTCIFSLCIHGLSLATSSHSPKTHCLELLGAQEMARKKNYLTITNGSMWILRNATRGYPDKK